MISGVGNQPSGERRHGKGRKSRRTTPAIDWDPSPRGHEGSGILLAPAENGNIAGHEPSITVTTHRKSDNSGRRSPERRCSSGAQPSAATYVPNLPNGIYNGPQNKRRKIGPLATPQTNLSALQERALHTDGLVC